VKAVERKQRQAGSTMTEFVIVGPLIMLIALTGLQFMLLQYARLNLDYAGFEAVRAGAKLHADPEQIREAWYRALVPWMVSSMSVPGYDRDADPRVSGAVARRVISGLEAAYTRFEIVSPSHEAFEDFSDPRLQRILRTGQARVIPNDNLGSKPSWPGAHSGISIQDANILKLRITYGYKPAIPLAGKLLTQGVQLAARAGDPFYAGLLAAGRIPVVVESTLPMLSPAIENDWIQSSAAGTNADDGNDSGQNSDDGIEDDSAQGGGAGANNSGQPGEGGTDDLCL
jgi:hypothetical protein